MRHYQRLTTVVQVDDEYMEDGAAEKRAQAQMNMKPRGGLVLVTLLVECGADINAVNKYNRTREHPIPCSFGMRVHVCSKSRECICTVYMYV